MKCMETSPSCIDFPSAISWKLRLQATGSYGLHHHLLPSELLESYNFRTCSAEILPLGKYYEQSTIEIKEPSVINKNRYCELIKNAMKSTAYKNILSHHQRRFHRYGIRLGFLDCGHFVFNSANFWDGLLWICQEFACKKKIISFSVTKCYSPPPIS